MTNSKLQAAIDELERLYATVQSFKARNGALPKADSDAGRALFALETFAGELKQLHIGKLVFMLGCSATATPPAPSRFRPTAIAETWSCTYLTHPQKATKRAAGGRTKCQQAGVDWDPIKGFSPIREMEPWCQ